MFSNRVVLFYAAALSFLLPACSKQSDDADAKGGGGTLSTTTSILGNGGTGNGTGTLGGGNNSATDPNLVGSVVKLSEEQIAGIETSACNAWGIEPESLPSKLQLVVDVSSSMDNAAPGTRNTKWEVTRDALVEAICGVTGPGLGAGMAVGLMFYPNKRNDQVSRTPTTQDVCLNLNGITPMDVLGDNGPNTHRTELRTALTAAQLGLGTPTADAYDYALNDIALTEQQLAFPGDTYMLLITDGVPTLRHGCYNPSGSLSNLPGDEIVTLVDGAYGKGVKTFIIGSPGSEGARAWLSKAAFLGGTGKSNCQQDNPNGPYCHMDMTAAPNFSEALREGLQQVVNSVSQCKYEIPRSSADGSQTVDPNEISPIIQFANGEAELITRDNKNGEACTEGYRVIEGNTQLQLCKDTCARFQADAKATMQLIFGCTEDELITTIQ